MRTFYIHQKISVMTPENVMADYTKVSEVEAVTEHGAILKFVREPAIFRTVGIWPNWTQGDRTMYIRRSTAFLENGVKR